MSAAKAAARVRSDPDHGGILRRLQTELADVFEQSPDGVYLWLDERTKTCNERLARLFGCTVAEWEAAEPFLESFVAPDDRETFARNFHDQVRGLRRPVRFRFRAVRKDGTTFAAETDMVPLSAGGHPVAYHFVRAVGR